MAQDGWALGFASAELKSDKEVVLAAVAQNGDALVHASVDLKSDKEVVLAAVAQYGYALGYASAELNNDKEVVLAAVAQNGCALKHASAKLRNAKEVVLAAVAQNGFALELSWLTRGEFRSFVRPRVVAHHINVAFLLASCRTLGTIQPAPTPALWRLVGIGEDAGRHVQQLIAAFSGAPCGQAWALTRAGARLS